MGQIRRIYGKADLYYVIDKNELDKNFSKLKKQLKNTGIIVLLAIHIKPMHYHGLLNILIRWNVMRKWYQKKSTG